MVVFWPVLFDSLSVDVTIQPWCVVGGGDWPAALLLRLQWRRWGKGAGVGGVGLQLAGFTLWLRQGLLSRWRSQK
jgi:hypothetical protein